MQSLVQNSSPLSGFIKQTNLGHITQVRNHVKMYPWRTSREARECYLDPTTTPYTDRHNINEFRPSIKRQKGWTKKNWQKVVPKELENRYNSYKWNDSYKSDPAEAKETAVSKLQRFQDSLEARGFARESVAYNPPEGVEGQILSLFRTHQLASDSSSSHTDEDILNFELNHSKAVKFNLIKKCVEIFQHDVPNSYLNEIQCIRDLVEYYQTPVRGVNPYNALLRKENSLPPNLALISNAMRYDRENDEYFGGYNALPGIISKVAGLRGSKRYPTLNQDEFQWPDI